MANEPIDSARLAEAEEKLIELLVSIRTLRKTMESENLKRFIGPIRTVEATLNRASKHIPPLQSKFEIALSVNRQQRKLDELNRKK